MLNLSQEELKDVILAKNWELRVRRPGFLQSKQMVADGVCQKFILTKNQSVSYKNIVWANDLNLFDSKTTEKVMNKIIPAAFAEEKNWVLKKMSEINSLSKQKNKFIKIVNQQKWTNLTNEERIACISKYFQLQKKYSRYYAIAVPLTNYCEKVIENKDKTLLKYAVPYRALDLDLVTQSLVEIKKAQTKNKIKNLEEEHLIKFVWIKNCYNITEPYTKEELKQELTLKQPVNVRTKIVKHPLKHIVVALQVGIYLRNHTKESMQQLWQSYEKFLPFLAKQFGVSRDNFLRLTHEEIVESLKNGKLDISKKEIEDRKRGFIIGVLNGKILMLTGVFAKKLVCEIENSFNKANTNTRQINGFPASLGYVVGKARVINKISEITKLKHGEILITSMTTPDFIVGMKRAGAIVTDEGGLSCHAAVVSRELGVPCVIGTKNATQIIGDGDLIEVDASVGIVKIIQKAKK